MTSLELQKFRQSISDFPRQDYHDTLTHILHLAITITSADKGNIQVLDPLSRTLRITVHEGFSEPFLRFFDTVGHRQAAVCANALKMLERVIVEDVKQSPIFMGTEALSVLLEAGVQAVQSTPLISSSGSIVGMMSTHYGVPKRPTREQLHLLDELAVTAAEFISAAHLIQS